MLLHGVYRPRTRTGTGTSHCNCDAHDQPYLDDDADYDGHGHFDEHAIGHPHRESYRHSIADGIHVSDAHLHGLTDLHRGGDGDADRYTD